MLKYLLVLLVITALAVSGAKLMSTHNNNDNDKAADTVKIFNAETGKVETVPKIVKTDAEWRKQLTPEQYRGHPR